MFSRVLFPAPEAPTIARIVPRGTSRSAPWRTSSAPCGVRYDLRTPDATRTGAEVRSDTIAVTCEPEFKRALRPGAGWRPPGPVLMHARPDRVLRPGKVSGRPIPRR